jgi:hypothetical protein
MWQRHILQLKEPEECEPLCSGLELTIARREQLELRHFHAQVVVRNRKPGQWLFAPTFRAALHCQVIIFGQVFSSDEFSLTGNDIGSTLFCAGFPCLSITGLDEVSGAVTVTCAEIVESDLPTRS